MLLFAIDGMDRAEGSRPMRRLGNAIRTMTDLPELLQVFRLAFITIDSYRRRAASGLARPFATVGFDGSVAVVSGTVGMA
jgi:hypothetical protein